MNPVKVSARKPNFSGTWKANFSKSALQIRAPESTIFTIEHDEPTLALSRTHVCEGKSDTWSIRLTTDGEEVVRQEAERELRCRMSWEGDVLVFDVKILTDGEEATDRVTYALAEDGKSFTARERYRSARESADNTWVLEKQETERR